METDTAPQCQPGDKPPLVGWSFAIEGREPLAARLPLVESYSNLTPEMRRQIAKLVGEQFYATLCREMAVDDPRDISGVSAATSIRAHRERYPDDPK
jgi:hypothetical protein